MYRGGFGNELLRAGTHGFASGALASFVGSGAQWAGLRTYGVLCATTLFGGIDSAALICFLESKDYVDCLKLAIALGDDADTLAAIAGPMAYAYYREMPEELIENAKATLPEWMLWVNE